MRVGECVGGILLGLVGGADCGLGVEERLTRESTMLQGRAKGGRVLQRLVDDQVRDDARVGVRDAAGIAVVGVRDSEARPKVNGIAVVIVIIVWPTSQKNEWLPGRTPGFTPWDNIVKATVDCPQPEWQQRA
ncbi:hypothetical protein [Roseomonas fluvialis]|uniref:hypothetical protein n=1 Tax=Roseomonas fluvialis TaxID=1750527 RepID=UPI001FCAEA44|nr:hypothetical protein [Roseomonas fluvialis]